MTAPDAPAVITLREVYDLVVEVKSEVTGHGIPAMRADIEDHEQRIRGLEKWIWRASGIAAAIGAAGGAIITKMVGAAG